MVYYMTQSQVISHFIDILQESINEINKFYYGSNYWNCPVDIYGEFDRIKDFNKYLSRYQERTFCYELYHQLRKRLENINGNTWPKDILLQSEWTKFNIHPFLVNIYKVKNLNKEFMPDFLLHTPDDSTNQLVVMEVKTNPNVPFKDVKYDLLKIQKFIQYYKYQQGIMLLINIENRNREILVNNIKSWALENKSIASQIKIFFKSTPDSPIYECNVSD